MDDAQNSRMPEVQESADADIEPKLSPEALLEVISAETSDAALFPGTMREQWFFTYDLLMDQATISRFILKMNVNKIVKLPHYRLDWPFFYPPLDTSLPSLIRTNREEDEVWGLIYECRGKDFRDLERFLRVPNRYHRAAVQVRDRGGRRFPAFTYVLTRSDEVPRKPSATFLDQLVEIAAERELPGEWLESLRAVEVQD
jgi:hypothetical protein